MVGKGIIITTLQLKLFIGVFKTYYCISYIKSSLTPPVLRVESVPVTVPTRPRGNPNLVP